MKCQTAAVMGTVVTAVTMQKRRPPFPVASHPPRPCTTMKIIFSWGQILSSFNLTFDIPWPKTFDTVMTALYAPFNIDIFFFFENFKCQVNTNYSAAFYAHMSVPMIILGVIMLATVTAGVIKLLDCCGNFLFDRKTLKARVFKLINFFVFVMYPGLGLRVFRVFATQTYGNRTFLRATYPRRCVRGLRRYGNGVGVHVCLCFHDPCNVRCHSLF